MSEPFFFPQFWVLFQSPSLIPTKDMTDEEKMNTITRLILIVSLIIFVYSGDPSILFGTLLSLFLVVVIYNMNKSRSKEKFENSKKKFQHLEQIEKDVKNSGTKQATAKNPLSNVLLPEISFNPRRKPAQQADDETIDQETKKMIQKLNPDIHVNTELFGDAAEKFQFDQSQRQFYSTANTRVANDQGAFAKWLYGNMPSAKEGDPVALLQDNARYVLR